MKYNLLWSTVALNNLNKICKQEAKKIVQKVENYLTLDPENLGKPLTMGYKGFFSYRVGNYRVVYEVSHQKIQILIIKVGHRSVVYD